MGEGGGRGREREGEGLRMRPAPRMCGCETLGDAHPADTPSIFTVTCWKASSAR